MSRTIYNQYAFFANVNGGADILSKIRTFALSVGWSSRYYEVDKVWQLADPPTVPPYEFASGGTQKHLELNSTGYGLQTLTFRFMCENIDGQSDRIWLSAISPANEDVDYYSSTSPYLVGRYNYSNYFYMSVPSSSFPQMLLIGNESIIICHMRVNSVLTLCFAFGTYELLPSERAVETEMQAYWVSQYLSYNWYDKTSPSTVAGAFFPPFQLQNRNVWVDGQSYDAARIYAAITFDEADGLYERWSSRSDIIATNSFSGFRTLVASPVFRKSATTGVFRCIGHLPCYIIPFGGLTWGEIISRGSESYLAMPGLWTTQRYGVAYRVA